MSLAAEAHEGAAQLLSPEQQLVVVHGPGALLVFAGPGTGKTRTLTARIAELLRSGRAQPSEILALTFTVRATEEMRVRLTGLIGQQAASAVTSATFHSLGAKILRRHAAAFGRTGSFSIYDANEELRVIREVLADQGHPDDGSARDALTRITLAKGRLSSPAALCELGNERTAAVWEAVEDEMRRSNAFDFADLLTNSVALLTDEETIRARYRRTWRHIVVDEFQDTDGAQFALLHRLAGPSGGAPHGSLVVTGDDDQLLYPWRGADVENLLGFQRAYPCAAELVLRRNYRCRPEILEPAARCISHNTHRRHKTLVADKPRGGSVSVLRFANDHQEAAVVARRIWGEIARGTDPRAVLVLCRSLRFTQPLQRALTSAGIAYRVIGAHTLWERVEVLDALAYIALVSNPDDAAAFRRAVGAPSDRRQFQKGGLKAPSRGVGAATQRAIIRHARDAQINLIDACAQAEETEGLTTSSAARTALVRFGRQLAQARDKHQRDGQIARAVIATLTITGGPVACYDELETTDNSEVAADCARIEEDLRSLCRAAQTYERSGGRDATLAGFLEHARVNPTDALTADEDNRLTISTIHGAKGTEAEVVFVIGCEERLLPIGYAIDASDPLRVEEERRLFYVAASRAKDRLNLTTAAERLGAPTRGTSRFIEEAGV